MNELDSFDGIGRRKRIRREAPVPLNITVAGVYRCVGSPTFEVVVAIKRRRGLRGARQQSMPFKLNVAREARDRHSLNEPEMHEAQTASPDRFTIPVYGRHFEDYVVGNVYEYGSVTVDAAEIMEFGRTFDRQPLHTDRAEAAAGPFGELIASGWHTAALMMRLFTTNYVSGPASVGGLGVDELRWLRPVRAGDVLRIRVKVLDTRVSKSKPDRGVLRTFVETINQDGEVVLVLTVSNLMLLRSVSTGP